ncbi:M20/M25/M40 family metallo-hydrolase [Oscillochloris sp. ZM17-4]|uniref:M20/M25/M40 family metallo-hydrolase n=1 Tax=Oscillochloris sp. ZM17-4 TaxID=2866714 RepID=UPI001C7399B2|nr:M20/M25/M40 family metallo-hydrolase [Oscillochloris sp. ZM17-4]MBX0330449.1 M20/M25/M40 family metallo-hydrolase [Oscillochloris sp. ZM17-4]
MDIHRWRADPAVQRASADLADYRPVLETAIAVQQVPAPTFDERRRGELVVERMRGLGLQDVEHDAIGNVYGRRPGRSRQPGLLVSAHLDTVFPIETDLRIRRDGERVYGPGIGDNSTGVAGLLHLADAFQRHDLPNRGDVWFVANVGEEGLGDLRGIRAAVDRLRDHVAAVVVLEGCDFGTLHHQAIGVRRYRIEAAAPGGHSWGNYGNPSAIHALVRLASRISELSVPRAPRTTFNIGVIEGGTSVNTIAQHASMLLDMRSVSASALADLAAQVDRLVRAAAAEHPDVRVSATTVGDRPSGTIPREHPLVQAAVGAYQAAGATISFQQSSTDANIPLSQGLPAICVGITDGGNAHRLDEFILPQNLGPGMQALLLLSMAACG